jgi:hypothetical protein
VDGRAAASDEVIGYSRRLSAAGDRRSPVSPVLDRKSRTWPHTLWDLGPGGRAPRESFAPRAASAPSIAPGRGKYAIFDRARRMREGEPESTRMNPFFAALVASAYLGLVFVIFGLQGEKGK